MPGAAPWRVLDKFSLDDLPMFTRTVLTSSPVLVLPTRGGAPFEAGCSFRGSFVSSSNANPPVSLVRQHSSSTAVAAEELPLALQLLLRLHKRDCYNLFQKWESAGMVAVPLDVFAEGVRAISGERLSDADLLKVLTIVEPLRGDDVLVGERWRTRTLDRKRLWRKLHSSAARAASQYIRQSTAASPSPRAQLRGEDLSPSTGATAWASMLEERTEPPASEGVLEEPPMARIVGRPE